MCSMLAYGHLKQPKSQWFAIYCAFSIISAVRGVAQPGSALRSGRRGRRFESGHPDRWKATCTTVRGLFDFTV